MIKMNEDNKIKEIKISKFRMVMKFAKLFFFTMFRTKWFLPGVKELTVDELNERISSGDTPIIIDTRDRVEYYGAEGSWKKYGHIKDSMSIPIMQLTSNIDKLVEHKDKDFVTICPGGGMSLVAAEILVKAGFENVYSLKGGMDNWDRKGYPTTTEINSDYPIDEFESVFSQNKGKKGETKESSKEKYTGEVHKTVDARNFSCPIPVLNSKKAITKMKIGQVLEILTTDPGSKTDIPAWAKVSEQELLSMEEANPEEFRFIVKKIK